jgi:hypothetical protein
VKSGQYETIALANTCWRVSSYSGGNNECVEVASAVGGLVPVRDSKWPEGEVLTIGRNAWSSFVSHLR